jgi:hypothetical protein
MDSPPSILDPKFVANRDAGCVPVALSRGAARRPRAACRNFDEVESGSCRLGPMILKNSDKINMAR